MIDVTSLPGVEYGAIWVIESDQIVRHLLERRSIPVREFPEIPPQDSHVRYVPRLIEPELRAAARSFSAVILTGPRGAGKTKQRRI